MYPIIQDIPCESAVDFINSIALRGPHFQKLPPYWDWIFRGHGDDAYKLLPSALRPEKGKLSYVCHVHRLRLG